MAHVIHRGLAIPTPSSTASFTIAGVRLNLQGLRRSDFLTPIYHPFFNDSLHHDLSCDLHRAGPDPALENLTDSNAKPWHFELGGKEVVVIRRDSEGRILWKLRGMEDLTEAQISWHPEFFEACYMSYARSWTTGLGITALGLRIRTAGGLIMHGLAASLDGAGIIGVGIPEVGKSTLARLLHIAGARCLTDERLVLRPNRNHTGKTLVHGTPWPSSAGLGRAESAPLKRIYFLEHGSEDAIIPISPDEAFRRLIPVTTIAWHCPDLLGPSLESLDRIIRETPCARLAFRPTPAVLDTIAADLADTSRNANP